MNAYIDLSIIVFFINYLLSIIYSTIILDNIKYHISFLFISALLAMISVFINIFFVPYFFIMGFIILALFMAIFDCKYLKIILLTLIINYINSGFLLLVGGSFLYKGILLISTPFSSLFILFSPIYMIFIHLIASYIYKKVKYSRFIIKCNVRIDKYLYKGKGYYDSGNLLLFNERPVIFINGKSQCNNGEIINIKGINDYSFKYLAYKSELIINKKIIQVYSVFVSNGNNFNNCNFLLNKYVL